jgi:mono/diheme cytochrome c family protein
MTITSQHNLNLGEEMKILLKIVAVFSGVLAILLVCGGLYLKFFLPNIKVKDVKVDATKERVERGRYLANAVLVCVDCHSTRDWSKYSGPLTPGTEGMGGEVFDQTMGLPGRYSASNITPYHLGSWSDGEIYRAITSGVGKRNNVIFPIMPCAAYGSLDDEDVFSVIAYLRTMPSIKNDVLASKSDFPVNFLVNTLAKEGHPTKRPPVGDALAYGKYITQAASCLDCHTPFEKGKLVLEKSYSGGRAFPLKGVGTIVSTNITFDKNTGIGEWDKETFIAAFKGFDKEPATVEKGAANTIMPWVMYAKMDPVDLGAIYDYLKSLPPVENKGAKPKPVTPE